MEPALQRVESLTRQLRLDSICAGPAQLKPHSCIISDEKPDLALMRVLQIAGRGCSFCVVPAGTDEAQQKGLSAVGFNAG